MVSSEPYQPSFETYTGYTSDGDSIDLSQKGWSPLTLVKNVDGLDLVFTINLPKPSPYDTDDALWLYLDYDADGATDAFILWSGEFDEWVYFTSGGAIPIPSWMTASRNGNQFTIRIPYTTSQPFTPGEPYRFYLFVTNEYENEEENYLVFIFIPEIMIEDPFDSSNFIEEELPDPGFFIIPEVPFGTVSALVSMIGAYLFKSRYT